MFAIIVFILILSFLVLIHEAGHYFAARWAKIRVEEFGLGYPPRALTIFKKAGTIFSLNWVPFGGFVRMEGEDGPEEAKSLDNIKEKPNQIGPFYTKTAWQRLVVILAGVVVNMVFGIIAFSIVYSFLGIPTGIDQGRIAHVFPDSPAALAEMPIDVNIIAIKQGEESIPTQTNEDVQAAIGQFQGQTVTVVTTGACQGLSCQESAQEFEVYVRRDGEIPTLENGIKQGAIGIVFAQTTLVDYPWYQMPLRGIVVGLREALLMGLLILEALAGILVQLVQFGKVPSELAGPVGIVDQANEYGIFEQGMLMILNFAGMLSINLGIMNLLPIPALDGGRAMFIAFEKLFGRQRVARIEGVANMVGFAILISLIVLITLRDIWRIFV